MKGRLRYLLAAGAAVLLLAVLPPSAEAAILDINGNHINTDYDENSGVIMEDGVTLVSEDFLQTHFYLTTTRDGDAFTLTNAFEDFAVEGELGSRDLVMEGDMVVQMPLAAREEDGALYLPLRALMENFGEVSWNGAVTVRFDYNDQALLNEAALSDEPVQATLTLNDGFDRAPGTLFYDRDEGGNLWYWLNDDGYATSLGYRVGDDEGSNLIAVQHEGYNLHWVDVDDAFVYWWESPLGNDSKTSYLYIKSRGEDATPTLIAESDYVASGGGVRAFGDGFTAAKDGNVIWSVETDDGESVGVWLYQSATGETVQLDQVSTEDGASSSFWVTMGDQVAAWATSHYVKMSYGADENGWERYGSFGDIMLYEMASGETHNLSQRYNLTGPQIVGSYLIVQTAISAEDGAPNDACYWVYDLTEDHWAYRVTQDKLGIEVETNIYLQGVSVLDENHVALVARGFEQPYTLPVLDLASGTVHRTVDQTGEPLLYLTHTATDASLLSEQYIVEEWRPIGDWGESIATVVRAWNGELQRLTWGITFDW